MIDLHTHTFFSDGDLIPSELVRRAFVVGYKAIAITDHVDHSNIDIVLPGILKVSEVLNSYWNIFVIPGVEVTHVPPEAIPELVAYARKKGAKIIIGHGESPNEPVCPGTNQACIDAGVDILAHPGRVTEKDAKNAKARGVYLEITTRKAHSITNKHVFETACKVGAKLVLNTDTHSPEDLLTQKKAKEFLKNLVDKEEMCNKIFKNSEELIKRLES